MPLCDCKFLFIEKAINISPNMYKNDNNHCLVQYCMKMIKFFLILGPEVGSGNKNFFQKKRFNDVWRVFWVFFLEIIFENFR